ncbi:MULTISPECIES: integration host factor subunit beta [Methylomonas]|uniref:Integration host factor subunit beta n=2 Tax=Methylomonas TaxID=416 RepID=A0A126T1J1_9GAMM|nr:MULTISPECIES: integration host factor subunit beta [Methylomonas]AMK75951.1 integration host factor subunit beta [Methylomonas denitrificans]OAI02034.1 integration host factor subunit beta [Methylomonas methanica]TCV84032.1 integration host factor subunit beta [Methylomonas methanica]
MTKSELIAAISNKQPHLLQTDVELAINNILDVLTTTLANGERIEIPGFGGFSMVRRDPRTGRNPKTGEMVSIPQRAALNFKPGLDLRQKVDASRLTTTMR